jgi:hypothetical protein
VTAAGYCNFPVDNHSGNRANDVLIGCRNSAGKLHGAAAEIQQIQFTSCLAVDTQQQLPVTVTEIADPLRLDTHALSTPVLMDANKSINHGIRQYPITRSFIDDLRSMVNRCAGRCSHDELE